MYINTHTYMYMCIHVYMHVSYTLYMILYNIMSLYITIYIDNDII